jgi:hypothetical protein
MLTAFRKVRGALQRLQLGGEILAIVADKAASGGLPVWRQLLEMLWLKLSREQTFRFYLMARMWRPTMRWADKRAHFNYRDFSRLVDNLNPPARRQPYRHKLEQKRLLQQHHIPTPDWFGFFHAEHGHTAAGAALTNLPQLIGLLAEYRNERLAFKRVVGSGGEGFLSYIVRSDNNGQLVLQHPVTGQSLEPAMLYAQLRQSHAGYLIEAYLVQHPALAQFNPDSINTLRIWVTNEACELRVVGTFLRIGRRHVMVDNTAAGGLICTLDEHTGILQELTSGDLRRTPYSSHPDSGISPRGIAVPFFTETKQLALQALSCFPGMGIAGLDIAITAQGPSVIEVNLDNPAQIGTACFDRPGRLLFPRFFGSNPAHP